MAEQRYCSKCRKTMADVNFYTYRDGTKCELCKSCLTMHLNNYDESSYLWILQKFDVPYIESEWKASREKEFTKAYAKAQAGGSQDPQTAAYNMTKGNGAVIGKYLSKMKMVQWKNYFWADTEMLKEKAAAQAKLYGEPDESMQEQLNAIKEAYANGEISEAQYLTYMDINPNMEKQESLEDKFLNSEHEMTQVTGYPVNDHPFEEIAIPDVGNDLTPEDKIYLATKWGRLYTAADWLYLEEKYNDFMASFDIQGAARIDTLIQICKLSLKLNQALDTGDIDSYSKLARSYDALMKSAKFTEAQNKEGDSAEFDSVGAIVAFCESKEGGGYIPEMKIEAPLDVIDTIIEDNKEYIRTLWHNDTNLTQQIEQFLKKQEILAEQKADKKKAKEQGLEAVEISDNDYADFYAAVQADVEEDQLLVEEDEE